MDGSWSGVVGELQRKELDFSLADLSVTSERAEVNQHIFRNSHQIVFTSLIIII